jgi:hypothetical protein
LSEGEGNTECIQVIFISEVGYIFLCSNFLKPLCSNVRFHLPDTLCVLVYVTTTGAEPRLKAHTVLLDYTRDISAHPGHSTDVSGINDHLFCVCVYVCVCVCVCVVLAKERGLCLSLFS